MDILVVSGDTRIAGVVSESGSSVVSEPSPTIGVMKLLLDGPQVLICEATGDGPAGLDGIRKLIKTADLRRVPFIAITSWRDILFEETHYIHQCTVSHSILLRPFKDADLGREVSALICAKGG